MSKDDKKRTFIFIDESDYDNYKELKETHYFKSKKNIDLFLCATLIGIYCVKEPMELDNSSKKDYIRVNDNQRNDAMPILKSLAISKYNDVNILSNENDLFGYCENYANSGIKQLYAWYKDPAFEFDTILAKELLKCWAGIDFDLFKE